MHDKICPNCKSPFTCEHKQRRYCDDCLPKVHYAAYARWIRKERSKKIHSRAARKWQKNNLGKDKARQLAFMHPDRLDIIYECRCVAECKHQHHFDYSKPYDVILLCDHCHATEHARLRSLINEIKEV